MILLETGKAAIRAPGLQPARIDAGAGPALPCRHDDALEMPASSHARRRPAADHTHALQHVAQTFRRFRASVGIGL